MNLGKNLIYKGKLVKEPDPMYYPAIDCNYARNPDCKIDHSMELERLLSILLSIEQMTAIVSRNTSHAGGLPNVNLYSGEKCDFYEFTLTNEG